MGTPPKRYPLFRETPHFYEQPASDTAAGRRPSMVQQACRKKHLILNPTTRLVFRAPWVVLPRSYRKDFPQSSAYMSQCNPLRSQGLGFRVQGHNCRGKSLVPEVRERQRKGLCTVNLNSRLCKSFILGVGWA